MWIFKWPSTIYLKDHSFTLLWKSKWHLTVTLVLNQVTVCFWTLCSIDLSVYLWHPTPVLLPGKSHGWRSLVGCSPWDHEESKSQTWLSDFTFSFLFPLSCIGEGNGNPLQYSCHIYSISENGFHCQELILFFHFSNFSLYEINFFYQFKRCVLLPFGAGCKESTSL